MNFVNVHVGEAVVGRLPIVPAIVAEQHTADFNAGV